MTTVHYIYTLYVHHALQETTSKILDEKENRSKR